jgi:hypothetical protein
MWYRMKASSGCLTVELFGRRTPEETRQFLEALAAEMQKRACASVLIFVGSSIPIFSVGKYDLPSYLDRLAGTRVRIALLADSPELRVSHEYLASVAAQRGASVRSFDQEADAVQWLRERR